MNLKMDELERITLALLARLRETVGKEVELSTDYFWHINQEEKYDPYKDPKNIDLGQLSDDMKELRRLLKEDDAVSYDLERLANILAATSNELSKKNLTF